MRRIFFTIIFLLVILVFSNNVLASECSPIEHTKKDKCPVCGMFVYKYPDWVAQIVFKDRSYAVFDGAKDLFRFHLNIHKYKLQKGRDTIDCIFVTDYYTLKRIDAEKAFFVFGSDIYGPMGSELIPFTDKSSAKEFMSDHAGKGILSFSEITNKVVNNLDKQSDK